MSYILLSFTVVLLLLEFMLVTALLSSTACVLRNKHITPNIIIDIVAATLLLTTVTVATATASAPAAAAPAVVVAIDLQWPWYCHTIILVVFISNIAINCLCGTRTKQADIMSL